MGIKSKSSISRFRKNEEEKLMSNILIRVVVYSLLGIYMMNENI